LAIFLDGQLVSAPVVQEKISQGEAVISGDFTIETANQLAIQLNAGALPVPITVEDQRTVGATLGADSIQKSLFAGVIAVLAVVVFMIANYKLPGILAALVLSVYSLTVLAIFKFIPVTLTLAGIAGFILSIGIAVDANVLIFERLREELRQDRSLRVAIENAFSRAWVTIRDSNVSGLITTLILFWFGSGIIKGFALTLSIGILVSMFTAIFVTKQLFRIVTDVDYIRSKSRWFY
jgi:preprotein translocase subunit SecD